MPKMPMKYGKIVVNGQGHRIKKKNPKVVF